MNDLHSKYKSKGLAIIGVTGEAQSKIEGFAQTKGMKYQLGTGASYDQYKCKGIPHAWLIGPRGTVLWKGHPSSLQEDVITEHLKSLVIAPSPNLPKSMKKTMALLSRFNVDKAIGDLERHAKRPKKEGEDALAQSTIDDLVKYGESLLAKAETHIKAGEYHLALELLDKVEKGYKRHALGKKAKARKAELKADKATRPELDAAKVILLAEKYARMGNFTTAVAAVAKVVKSKKYAETKMLATARKLQKTFQAQLLASGGAKKR